VNGVFAFLKSLFTEDSQQSSRARERAGGASEVIGRYFTLSERIEKCKADRDYYGAIAAARETYSILPRFVEACTREYGRFDIVTSHAVHTASTLMAVTGDLAGISELRSVLQSIPELGGWIPIADQAARDADLVKGIIETVAAQPGLLQIDLRKSVANSDARRLSTLADWLEKAVRIKRVRKGSSYELFLVTELEGGGRSGKGETPSSAMQLSTRKPSRPSEKARIIDLSSLAYVRLPMAPPVWEERRRQEAVQRESQERVTPRPLFGVDETTWRIAEENRLPPAERPNSAFSETFPTGRWTYWLDSKGRREGYPDFPSVLQVTDPAGRISAERGLMFDVYRSDVNTDGSGIIFLSRKGTLHAYNQRVEPILEESLTESPEYLSCSQRLGIEARELKSHVRCVALSNDRERYLYTVVDEAWCVSRSGEVLWGLRMPTQEGWTRVFSARSDRVGTSTEVDAALSFMNLSYPISPDLVTQQYRRLAMQWHPDRNPGDPDAVGRMQHLNAAMDLLTGVDLSALPEKQLETASYQKILSTHRIDLPGGGGITLSIGLGGSEKSVADWIYAANFGWRDNRVFLASYGGKVVEVSSSGTPTRVYDIGSVPRHIGDTGGFLYLLTDTRLYVLAGEQLESIVDVFDQGHLLLAERGFGLLGQKTFTWFSQEGRRVGAVTTRDPIRRVFSTDRKLVVETRQHRAKITGAPPWWSTPEQG